MSAVATETGAAVLALLEMEQAAINMTGLVALLPGHDPVEVKRLTNDLYMQRQIGRVPIMGVHDRYYAFIALTLPTSRARPQLEEPPAPPAALALPDVLGPDEAVQLLERAGWKSEPEVVTIVPDPAISLIERRKPDRRALTTLEVIKRWRLSYPLGRVVDLIGSSKGQLGRVEAAQAIKMLREHVRGDE